MLPVVRAWGTDTVSSFKPSFFVFFLNFAAVSLFIGPGVTVHFNASTAFKSKTDLTRVDFPVIDQSGGVSGQTNSHPPRTISPLQMGAES